MGKVRTRSRRDGNEKQLVALARKLGATWCSTASTPGELDGIIGCAGIDVRVEIKDGSRPPSERALTPQEINTIESWAGRKPVVIESEDDLIELLNTLRREPCTTGART
jgi:hypothetical protein